MQLNDEHGFTLIELMFATAIGLVILLAAALGLETFMNVTQQVADRTDNAQIGRRVFDNIEQSLRSQACPSSGGTSILAGDSQSIDYVTDLGDGTTGPERRVLRYDPSANTLTEARYAGTRDPTTLAVTFAATPYATTQLLDQVRVQTDPTTGVSTPMFQFYPSGTTGATGALATPLSASDLPRVAGIALTARRGIPASSARKDTSFAVNDMVTLRSVDPANPQASPCQ